MNSQVPILCRLALLLFCLVTPVSYAAAPNAWQIVDDSTAGGSLLKVRLHSDDRLPAVGDTVWVRVLDTHTCYYKDEELVA